MRLLYAAMSLAATVCWQPAPLIAANAPAASAPFYLGSSVGAVRVINGFTGRTEATIKSPGGRTWYACGAAEDDRTFLLCTQDKYYELRLANDGTPRWLTAPADIPVAARNTGNGNPLFAVSPDVFNPVITPDGSTIIAAAWTSELHAELAEFSARTGRLIAVLMPSIGMPGQGFPCQALWTDPSGSHLIAYCGVPGVANDAHFTSVDLHIPNTSGTTYAYTVVW